MKYQLWTSTCGVFIISCMLWGCSEADQREIQARAVQEVQTAAAIAKTTAMSAAQTAAAEGLRQVQTQTANLRQTVEASVPTRSGVSPYTVDSNLTELADVTGPGLDAAIKAIRPDSPLVGLGQTFVDVGRKHGMNAFYIAAHSAWESTWGTSPLAGDKNNLFGYGAYDSCPYECAWTFKTKQECVETVMPIIKADYLTEGGKYYNGPTLRGMNSKYATDQNWKNGIAKIINSLASKVP